MPQREVARMTGRTRTAVARIFTAFRDDNGRIHDAPHDVRPRSTTDEEDRWIVAAAVDQPFITARDIRGELEERGVAVMPWPPKGADMNPIENIWGNMKIQLSRRGLHSVTTDQLWDAVKEEWDRLRQCPELVVNLYESLPRKSAGLRIPMWRVRIPAEVLAILRRLIAEKAPCNRAFGCTSKDPQVVQINPQSSAGANTGAAERTCRDFLRLVTQSTVFHGVVFLGHSSAHKEVTEVLELGPKYCLPTRLNPIEKLSFAR
ncbi:hypothetical protein HPB47_016516 [Ixodes persulcatus]|uniref:Uncharacterized protein n=1 Tax=Ixodes persulcatus TaxID=34615 RepID=A0AC60QQP3_IXOPE|nr:hypothetical protein HPB47_016516 [Ixodes persulcatus]